jgi:hypothetical protein
LPWPVSAIGAAIKVSRASQGLDIDSVTWPAEWQNPVLSERYCGGSEFLIRECPADNPVPDQYLSVLAEQLRIESEKLFSRW